MELADLDELDFASWKNPWADLDDEAPERDEGLDRVLTLRKLLETVADYDRRVEVAIETKHPTRYGGLVERRVVDLLRDFGWDAARRAGPGDELLVDRAAADRAAGARRAARDAASSGRSTGRCCARVIGRRLDRRARHRGAAGAPRARPPDRAQRARDARVDRQHPRPTSALPGPRGHGRHHRPPGVHARPARRR